MMESTSETNQLLLHSSSSLLPRWHYDVFLSFRGEDTRKSFTDHLFAALCRAGVHTFRDAEELRKGEDISTDLIKAIQQSMISIIVFSKTYASSRWCLEEVVKIVECKEKVKQVVLPVFYDVDPSEVRKQTGGFGDALDLHQQRFGTEKVSQWKTALTKVANFSGWDLQNIADGYESKFIDNIVEKVLRVLVNGTYFYVAKYPVGIHTRVKEILSLLQGEANDDVRMIGIYGMGGVGKTTLAKAVFNKIYRTFDGSCFLGDVRKECVDGGHAGLKCLQEQLLCKTLNRKRLKVHHVDQGISLIKGRLGLKKVLIVVDDVDCKSQLDTLVGEQDWFGLGSTIIITTRNVSLLNGLGKDCKKYNVAMLSPEESLELFSWQAFNNPNPLKALIELSNMIVSYAGGLPLALTVLGSHFRARSSVQEWKDDLEKLRRIPHNDIWKILKISYDALDDDTQRIFLDIACFFTDGYINKEEIVRILNGCGFFAQSGITTLIDRCLLREDLYMHDLVRDMGREIVREESPMHPEKRSRLFLCDEVMDVLVSNKGTEAIETMIIDLSMKVHLSTKVFSKMTRLRILKILSMNVKGSLKYLSNVLRLLYWDNCPLRRISSDLCLEKLVILKLGESDIEEFQPNLQHFRCLQILRLYYCKQLKRAPNLAGAHSLKELSLIGCSKLVELPQSIGDLKNLVDLYLSGCENLKALPSSICNLKSLKCLDLAGCSKIKELPQSIGDLKNLVKLQMCRCKNLRALPSSICNLKSLKCLYLQMCSKIKELPQSIGDLKNLVDLYLSGCKNLRAIPSSICNLKSLKCLYLQRCSKIKELPQSIGDLKNLVDLYLSGCKNLKALPSSICNLKSLKCLYLDRCSKIKELPQSIGDLKNLVDLYLSGCKNLRALPSSICNLKSLEYLYLGECSKIKELPQSIGDLKNLVKLQMWQCKNLMALPSSICNLKSLECLYLDKCSKIKELPQSIGDLKNLVDLYLSGCKNLRALPSSICNLKSLKCLGLGGCSTIKELPQSIGDLKNLVKLDMGQCKNLSALPSSICNLKSLEYLYLGECSKIKELPTNLGKLEQLSTLDASRTSVTHLPISCGSLRYLNYLALGPASFNKYVWYYDDKCIGHFTSSNANLGSLEHLYAPYHYVQHLDLQIGHGSLSLLEGLDLSYSDFDTLPFNLCHLSQLKDLGLDNCQNLRVIKNLPPSLMYLTACNCPLLENVLDLPPSLRSFSAENCPLLENVQDLSGLLWLEKLYLSNCSNLIELRGVENLVDLEEMDITGCIALSSKCWCVNLFKALFQSPTLRWFRMSLSKDMVPEYLWSNEVVGCSSNYTLPLFLKKKRIFIVVMISCLFDRWWLWESNMSGGMAGMEYDGNNELKCRVYDHFTEPDKVEELEVLIEFYLVEQGAEENLSIETCIVYEEEGEVYFFPINPNKVIKFHRHEYNDGFGWRKTVVVTITNMS